MTDTTDLYGALIAVQAQIADVAHDAKNKHHGYDYTSAEGMIRACKGPMAEHGLAFVTLTQRVSDGLATCRYAIIHGGASLEIETQCPVVPGAGRPADKATWAAYTECLGYALRGAFAIPRGGLDASGRDDTDYTPPAPREDPRPAAKRAAWDAWSVWAEVNGSDAKSDMAGMWAQALGRKSCEPSKLSARDLLLVADFFAKANAARPTPVSDMFGDQLPIASEVATMGADDGE